MTNKKVKQSIQRKEYLGRYDINLSSFIINLDLKENGEFRAISNIETPYPRTQGTYEVSDKIIEFDNGDKCYSIKLSNYDKDVIGDWRLLCFSWQETDYGLRIAHETKKVYYKMNKRY